MSQRSTSFALTLALTLAATAAVTARTVAAADAGSTAPVIRDLRTAALAATHADDRIPCRNFVMYASQVVRFFQLAEEIRSGGENHHNYMWFPCEARGHLDWDGRSYEFKLNLGRTAVLRTADGHQRFFGCKAACDGLLLGNRAWDAAGNLDE